ncbi:hypothetical protein IAT40_006790 [Kwoniella sp. CBS 6097]
MDVLQQEIEQHTGANDVSILSTDSLAPLDRPQSSSNQSSDHPTANEDGNHDELVHVDIHTLTPVIGWVRVGLYDEASNRHWDEVMGMNGVSVEISNVAVGALGGCTLDETLQEVWRRFRPCGRIDAIQVSDVKYFGAECVKIIILSFEDQDSASRAVRMEGSYDFKGERIPIVVRLRVHSREREWRRIRQTDLDQRLRAQMSGPLESQQLARRFESMNNSVGGENDDGVHCPRITTDMTLPAVDLHLTCTPFHKLSSEQLPPIFQCDTPQKSNRDTETETDIEIDIVRKDRNTQQRKYSPLVPVKFVHNGIPYKGDQFMDYHEFKENFTYEAYEQKRCLEREQEYNTPAYKRLLAQAEEEDLSRDFPETEPRYYPDSIKYVIEELKYPEDMKDPFFRQLAKTPLTLLKSMKVLGFLEPEDMEHQKEREKELETHGDWQLVAGRERARQIDLWKQNNPTATKIPAFRLGYVYDPTNPPIDSGDPNEPMKFADPVPSLRHNDDEEPKLIVPLDQLPPGAQIIKRTPKPPPPP